MGTIHSTTGPATPTRHGRDLVSIITPAFNAAGFVEKTVESVLAQTYQQWEMLIVDDCSKDDTRAVVRRLAQRDSRVRLIEHSTNLGAAGARNTALAAASGPLVAFLDSDDLWLPEKLERQIDFMQRTGSGFTYTSFRRITEPGTDIGALRPLPESLTYPQLLKNTAIVTSTVVIDRRITGDFRMVPASYDDFATWLAILRKGVCAHGVAEDLVRYRLVGAGLSKNKWRSASWVWRVYRDCEKLGLSYASWCFLNYAWRGYWKRRSL
jgi:teichuronic acid biosynthesis glycosyltransferase TuaG